MQVWWGQTVGITLFGLIAPCCDIVHFEVALIGKELVALPPYTGDNGIGLSSKNLYTGVEDGLSQAGNIIWDKIPHTNQSESIHRKP